MRRLPATLLVLALAAPPAAAQPTREQVAEADALFRAGRALLDAGRPAEACPKFERSQELDPGRGTLINLAACYEAIGKLAAALRAFRDVAEQARAAGDRKRLDVAAARARDLEARVPRLTIDLGAAPRPAGFELTLDGVPVALAEAGDLLVDPGRVVVAARAPGHEAFETALTLEADGRRATVTIPPLSPARAGDPDAAGAFAATRPPAAPGPARRRGRVIAGVATAGAGGLAIGAASILALGARASYDDALRDHCGGDPAACSPTGHDRAEAARRRGDVATVIGAVGVAAVAAGVVVWLTAPAAAERPAGRAQLVPSVSPDGAGVVLVGAF